VSLLPPLMMMTPPTLLCGPWIDEEEKTHTATASASDSGAHHSSCKNWRLQHLPTHCRLASDLF
jgi:hypothetical protein